MAYLERSFLGITLALITALLGTNSLFANQGPEPIIVVDSPSDGSPVTPGSVVTITGWAVDAASASGSGVSEIWVYLGGAPEDGGVALGMATTGLERPDVVAATGRPDWIASGYEIAWFVSGVGPGQLPIVVYTLLEADDSWGMVALTVGITGTTAGPGPEAPSPVRCRLHRQRLRLVRPDRPGPGSPPFPPPPGFTFTAPATADAGGEVRLSWVPLEGAAAYRIYVSQTGAPTGFTVLTTVNQSLGSVASSTEVGRLAPGATYVFQVRAVPAGGGEEIPVPLSGTAHGGLGFNPTVTGTASSLGNIRLTWPPIPQVSQYRIYRSASGAPGSWVVVQTVNQSTGTFTPATTITGLLPGETYEFQVRGVETSGREITVPGVSLIGLDPFFAPANLTATPAGGTQVSLSWVPSPTPRVVAHRVFIAPAGSTAFTPATVTNLTRTSATVVGLTPNTAYAFQVVAIDVDDRESGPSNIATATTRFP